MSFTLILLIGNAWFTSMDSVSLLYCAFYEPPFAEARHHHQQRPSSPQELRIPQNHHLGALQRILHQRRGQGRKVKMHRRKRIRRAKPKGRSLASPKKMMMTMNRMRITTLWIRKKMMMKTTRTMARLDFKGWMRFLAVERRKRTLQQKSQLRGNFSV